MIYILIGVQDLIKSDFSLLFMYLLIYLYPSLFHGKGKKIKAIWLLFFSLVIYYDI